MQARPVVRIKIVVILLSAVFAIVCLMPGMVREQAVSAQAVSGPLTSLRTVPVPEPSNLGDFIKDRNAAIALGKALFWDMQVGSDIIMACATCHFHAGADSRSKNQLGSGLTRVTTSGSPNPDMSFTHGAPNYQLSVQDFPFRKLADPNNRNSTVLSDTNDVASSQGIFGINLSDILPPEVRGRSDLFPDDPIFNVGGINVRRVEPRNTPTVINAVFNFRNFWDGRAQNDFNGVNPFGARDPNAKVVKVVGPDQLEQARISLNNASLASQAVGPPVSDFEMSIKGNSFRLIGRKMLSFMPRPLGRQLVHKQDSVLGPLSRAPNKGLTTNYSAMIRAAFKELWWNSNKVIKVMTVRTINDTDISDDHMQERLDDAPIRDANGDLVLRFITRPNRPLSINEFTPMEYNFALFFGLAVQMYEATLVSDDTPFDRFIAGNTSALTEQQQQGLSIFQETSGARCINCHGGTEFTNASVRNVERFRLFRRQLNVIDQGFNNIGVRPTWEDLGVGGTDPFGNPLSEARLAAQGRFFDPNFSPALSGSDIVGADGGFKTPGLRNVELTAPYFHNGGALTLRQVIDFYSRGGDFQPIVGREGQISPLSTINLTEARKEALVAFLKALTDERVRYHKAPFDHPEIFVPNGHPGDQTSVTNNGYGLATDSLRRIPAVGRNGLSAPLPNFLASP